MTIVRKQALTGPRDRPRHSSGGQPGARRPNRSAQRTTAGARSTDQPLRAPVDCQRPGLGAPRNKHPERVSPTDPVITERTVETNVFRLCAKLGVEGRTAAVATAFRLGLV